MLTEYRVNIKRQVIQAFRSVYNSATFPDYELVGKINFELEFPIIQERYPAIYVTWSETSVRNAGIGHFTLEKDEQNITRLFRHWLFEGSLNINVMSLDPLERDELASSVVEIMAFGRDDPRFKPFRDEIYDEDFVSFQINTDYLIPGGETTGPVPWENKDEYIYIVTYSMNAVGSFFTEPTTSGLIRINEIRQYPYKPGDPIPQGSQDPQDLPIPWT